MLIIGLLKNCTKGCMASGVVSPNPCNYSIAILDCCVTSLKAEMEVVKQQVHPESNKTHFVQQIKMHFALRLAAVPLMCIISSSIAFQLGKCGCLPISCKPSVLKKN